MVRTLVLSDGVWHLVNKSPLSPITVKDDSEGGSAVEREPLLKQAEVGDTLSVRSFHSLNSAGVQTYDDGEEVNLSLGVSPWRFWALFLFIAMSTVQNLAWILFSTLPDEARSYYAIDNAQVQRLVEVSSIIFIPTVFVMSPISDRFGLRLAFIISCSLIMLGGLARWLGGNSYTWLFFGQALNGMAGPIICNAPSQLAAEWFSADSRATATALAWSAQAIGVALGYLVAPQLAPSASDIPQLMKFLAYLGISLFVLSLTYPRRSKLAPTASAAFAKLGFLSNGTKRLFKNRHYVALLLTWGLTCGALVSLSTFLVIFMKRRPSHSSDQQLGWIGFVGNLTSLVGGVFVPALVDLSRMQRSINSILVGLFGASAILCAVFGWTLCSGPASLSAWVITSPYIILSFTYGAISPLVFELAAELSFPVAEETAAAWLNIFYMLFNVAAVELSSAAHETGIVVYGTAVAVGVCTLFLIPVRSGDARISIDAGPSVRKV